MDQKLWTRLKTFSQKNSLTIEAVFNLLTNTKLLWYKFLNNVMTEKLSKTRSSEIAVIWKWQLILFLVGQRSLVNKTFRSHVTWIWNWILCCTSVGFIYRQNVKEHVKKADLCVYRHYLVVSNRKLKKQKYPFSKFDGISQWEHEIST